MSIPPIPFLESARAGRNALWRYVATVLLALSLLVVGGGALLSTALLLSGARGLEDLPEIVLLAVELLPTGLLILGLWAGLRGLHGRRFATLLRPPGRRFRWGLLGLSAGLWLLILAAGDLALSLLYPGSYAFRFEPGRFWAFALAALLLLPIQVASEELMFRGYLTQAFGLAGGFWTAWLTPGVVFGLLHGYNPEISAYGWLYTLPVYIGTGLLLGLVTLRSSGLEMALGLHLANNLYGTLLVSYAASALPSPALFRITEYHAPAVLAVFVFSALIYLSILGVLARAHLDWPGWLPRS